MATPAALNRELALPVIFVRVQMTWLRIVTGIALTSFSSLIASTTVRGRCLTSPMPVDGLFKTTFFSLNRLVRWASQR